MSIELALALIFVPAAFWIAYAYHHDRFKPEPLVLTAFSYFLGFLAGWLCLHAYHGAPGKTETDDRRQMSDVSEDITKMKKRLAPVV